MVELEVIAGVAAGNSITTNVPCITVGRSQEDTVVIPDPHVSRHHGEVLQRGARYQYRDLSSTHGTVLRRDGLERPVEQVQLNKGDELLLAGPENVLRVNSVSVEAASADDVTLAFDHEYEDELGQPEEVFANDARALRAILRLDKRILSLGRMGSTELLAALMDHLAGLYPHLDYIAITRKSGGRVLIEQCGPVREGLIPRGSSRLLRQARDKKGGIIFNTSGGRVLSTESQQLDLRPKSVTVDYDTTGICVPLALEFGDRKYLQLERAKLHGSFTRRDLNLASAMVPRVVDRINYQALNERYDRIGQKAAIGIFAEMIAHDMKNYLAFAPFITEKLDDASGHPDVIKGVQRALKLAVGMGELSGSRAKPLDRISPVAAARGIAAEFSGLYKNRCRFEAVPAGSRVHIVSNEELLYRVLWNLVMNAYHAFENRDEAVTEQPLVRLRVENKGSKGVQIRVEDNAGGIKPKTFTYLTNSFRFVRNLYEKDEDLIRVVGAIHTMQGFTNRVGLFFTAVAVNDMHGTISAKTNEGKGTTFTLQLPKSIDTLRGLLKF